MQRACARIHEEARIDAQKRGMGTTLSCILFSGSHGYIAHVGDSRIYLLREGRIQQLTEDHTVYNELVKRGKLSKEQIERVAQKNAITRAVGVYERVEVDTLTIEVLPGDQFLLASDGLHGYIAHHRYELEGPTSTRKTAQAATGRGSSSSRTRRAARTTSPPCWCAWARATPGTTCARGASRSSARR